MRRSKRVEKLKALNICTMSRDMREKKKKGKRKSKRRESKKERKKETLVKKYFFKIIGKKSF